MRLFQRFPFVPVAFCALTTTLLCSTPAMAQFQGNNRNQKQQNVTIKGKLLSLSPRGLVIETDKGKQAIPFNARTSWNVTARAKQEILRLRSIVRVSGTVDWNNFYLIADASLTMYSSPRIRPTTNGATVSPEGRLTVTGQVVKLEPLVIQADRSCPPVVFRRAGNRAIGRYAARGRNFQIGLQPGALISVALGKAINAAGKDAEATVTIKVPGPRIASGITLTRKEVIDPADLPAAKKGKSKKGKKGKAKSGKKKDEAKSDPEKKDAEKKKAEKSDDEKSEKKE